LPVVPVTDDVVVDTVEGIESISPGAAQIEQGGPDLFSYILLSGMAILLVVFLFLAYFYYRKSQ